MEKQNDLPDSLKESLQYPRGREYKGDERRKNTVEGDGAPEVQIRPSSIKEEKNETR